jgi:hypothetical protein
MIEKLTTECSVVRTYQLLLPGYRGKSPFVDKQRIRQPNKSGLWPRMQWFLRLAMI